MLTLGLDPSLSGYGWAYYDDTKTGKSKCVSSGLWKTKSSEVYIDRYTRLRDLLSSQLSSLRPDKVSVETPPFGESYSEGLYGLFLYTSEALRRDKLDVVCFMPPQVKMYARTLVVPALPPTWKMDKPDMVRAASCDCELKLNHNVADAYLVGKLGSRFWNVLNDFESNKIQSCSNKVEHHLFLETHTYIRGAKKGTTDKDGLVFKEGDRFFRWSKG